MVGCGKKSYLGPAEIASFSRQDFNRSYTYDTFWHVVSTGCFYVLYLLTVNSHADDHFYKYFCFKYYKVIRYEISFSLIKIHVKIFYIHI